jgi:hypothetical protein
VSLSRFIGGLLLMLLAMGLEFAGEGATRIGVMWFSVGQKLRETSDFLWERMPCVD